MESFIKEETVLWNISTMCSEKKKPVRLTLALVASQLERQSDY